MTDWPNKMAQDTPEYLAFVDKFRPKKTTDDCYTPPVVYNAVADWVSTEYGVSRDTFVRPFYPGSDFEAYKYPDGCVVVDNPPFSIISRIVRFYVDRQIPFFIFAPGLTTFSASKTISCAITAGAKITYENGAEILTNFITNLEPPGLIVRTAPSLYEAIERAVNDGKTRAIQPKYVYPVNVLTCAMANRVGQARIEYRLFATDTAGQISKLDSQREKGKPFLALRFYSAVVRRQKKRRQKKRRQKKRRQKKRRQKSGHCQSASARSSI
jgi:hypothetical protein